MLTSLLTAGALFFCDANQTCAEVSKDLARALTPAIQCQHDLLHAAEQYLAAYDAPLSAPTPQAQVEWLARHRAKLDALRTTAERCRPPR